MFAAIEDFLLHKAVGRAMVIVAQAAASFALAHSGLLAQYGVSISVDPNTLSVGMLGVANTAGQWIGAKLASRFPTLAHLLGANVVQTPAAGS